MELVITQNITVDGVIEATEGWFGPGDDDEEVAEVLMEQTKAERAFLCGRRTFEDLRGYWPGQLGVDTTGIAESLQAADKRVVSATMTDPGWENTTVIAADPLTAIAELKASIPDEEGDMIVTGSMQLCDALVPSGLVDEYRLFVYPVVLGRGKRLWPDGAAIGELDLVEERRFASGIVLLTYRPR